MARRKESNPRRKEQNLDHLHDQRDEMPQAEKSKNAKAAQKRAEHYAVSDNYDDNQLKPNLISNIEKEITRGHEDFQKTVLKKIAEEITDALIDSQSRELRDNLKPHIASISGLFDDYIAIDRAILAHLFNVEEKAKEIRSASNLEDADSLFLQLQDFHTQEFTSKLKVQMRVTPAKMVETIKKALDVLQIPQPFKVASPTPLELTELGQAKQELAREREKIQDLEEREKTLLDQGANLLKDYISLLEECAKKEGEIIRLELELDSIPPLLKYQADSSGSGHHHMDYNSRVEEDPDEMKVIGKTDAGETSESD